MAFQNPATLALSASQGIAEQNNLAARTQVLNLSAQKMATSLQVYGRIQQALAKGGLPGADTTDKLFNLATIAAKAGDPDMAVKALQGAEAAGYHMLMATDNLIKAKADQVRAHAAATTSNAQILAGQAALIHDQPTLDAWIQHYNATMVPLGQPPIPTDTQYSPALVNQLRNIGLTAYQSGVLQHDAATQQQQAAHNKVMEKVATLNAQANVTRAAAAKANAETQREKEARVSKAGGKRPPSAPSPQSVNEALVYLKKEYPHLDSSDLYEAASETAAEAQQLLRKNPGLSYMEAFTRALAQTRQNITKTQGLHIPGYGDVGGKISYTSVTTPGQLPPELQSQYDNLIGK